MKFFRAVGSLVTVGGMMFLSGCSFSAKVGDQFDSRSLEAPFAQLDKNDQLFKKTLIELNERLQKLENRK